MCVCVCVCVRVCVCVCMCVCVCNNIICDANETIFWKLHFVTISGYNNVSVM